MARYLVFYWRLYRLHQRGVRLVWTVHDLDNHDTRHIRVETFAARRLCRILDAIILHGPLAKEILESRWGPNACRRIRAIPHFNYIESYKNDADRAGAQSALELNESTLTFLFLGLIRPYKGVREMVDAFSVCAKSNTRLIIAGRPVSDAIRREIGDVVAKDKRIRFIPGRVPDDDIQMYMNACDVVVLPYRRVSVSGAAVLAMSFGKPCIAPRAGCVTDILDENGAVFFDPSIPGDLERAFNETISASPRLEQMGRHNLERARSRDWSGVAYATANVYKQCLSS